MWLHRSARYQEKIIRAGFSAMGRSICDTTTEDMGRMATKSVMCQPHGTNGATAIMIITTMKVSENIIDHLNW